MTIRADLTVGADGRHSSVRREADFVPLDIGAPMDALWFKLSRRTTDADDFLGRVDAGQILVVFNRGEYWQCPYVIAFRRPPQGARHSSLRDHKVDGRGSVAGVAAKTKDGQLTIRADLTVGADGRQTGETATRREATAPLLSPVHSPGRR